MDEKLIKERVEILLDVIMKKCLWQFHSRAWDRERQNENIMNMITQILCDEPVSKETPEERCYYADAKYLAESYKKRFPWVLEVEKTELKKILQALKERLDYLLITGSLNLELTDPLY